MRLSCSPQPLSNCQVQPCFVLIPRTYSGDFAFPDLAIGWLRPVCPSPRGCGSASLRRFFAYVLCDVSGHGVFEFPRYGTGHICEVVTGDFTDAEQIAVGGGDEDLFSGIKVFWRERLLRHLQAQGGSNFQEDAASYSLEASGRQWRRENAALPHAKNLGGGTLCHLTAFVQQNNLVKSGLLSFGKIPNIIQPGSDLHTCQWGSGVAAVFAEAQAHRLFVAGKAGGIEDQVHLRGRLVTLPKAGFVIDGIDARGSFGDMVCAQDFVKLTANDFGIEGKRKMGAAGVLFEAAPVALISKEFAL